MCIITCLHCLNTWLICLCLALNLQHLFLPEFYTLWKHTPPQHPVLSCFRSDTLYVVMARHPKVWHKSMKKQLYDFQFDLQKQLWALNRNTPRRMPALEIYFRSLFNAWEFYMKGYLSWEHLSAGKNCYAQSDEDKGENCLGNSNKIPNGKRNILIVRYEGKVTSCQRNSSTK